MANFADGWKANSAELSMRPYSRLWRQEIFCARWAYSTSLQFVLTLSDHFTQLGSLVVHFLVLRSSLGGNLEGKVKRREVLKLLALGAAAPSLPSEALALIRGVQGTIDEDVNLKILTPHQNGIVTLMAEMLIPQTDTPGAKATRVNRFIDLIVADWYPEEDRTIFLAGIADVDERTQKRFGKNFLEASTAQREEILRVLGEQMAHEQSALNTSPRGYRGADPDLEGNFYLMFRQLTLTGYFTSEIGFTQQLHGEIIPGHFDGCMPVAATMPATGR